MNEALEKELINFLAKSIEGVDQTANFLSAEIPEAIRQLLIWHGFYNAICCFSGIILFLILIYANYRQVKFVIKTKLYNQEKSLFLMLNVLQIFIAVFIITLINIQWLKIWIAPKVWLIDFVATLVSK